MEVSVYEAVSAEDNVLRSHFHTRTGLLNSYPDQVCHNSRLLPSPMPEYRSTHLANIPMVNIYALPSTATRQIGPMP